MLDLRRLFSAIPQTDVFVYSCFSLTPHKSESFNLESVVISENFPLTAVSMFAASGPHYSHALAQVVSRANNVYNSFMKSEEGHGFSGQVGAVSVVEASARLLAICHVKSRRRLIVVVLVNSGSNSSQQQQQQQQEQSETAYVC